MSHRLLSWIACLWMASATVAVACRYSVRDTGFVDLGNSPLRLEFSPDGSFPESQRQALAQAAAAVLLDSNIAFSTVTATRAGEPASLRLVDAAGRSLLVASAADLPRTPSEAVRVMESLAASPLRDRLQQEALRAYAVVLVIEGTDETANGRVRDAATAAIASVGRLIPGMPKPVDVGPQLLTLSRSAQAAERILLWGLGFDPASGADPRLAIVYGRGRRLGTPLEGPLITQTVLRERLVLIGQDCECDLDRAWLRGPLLPGRWDRSRQELAAKSLGFDPENPVVRAEVSRIVERGPQPGQRRKTAGTAQALGYSEDSVDSLPSPVDLQDADEPASPPSSGQAPAQTRGTTPPAAPPAAATGAGASAAPRALWWLLGATGAVAAGLGAWLALRSSQR